MQDSTLNKVNELIYIIKHYGEARLDEFLKTQPNLDLRDQFGMTPLMYAIKYAKPSIVKKLLLQGANSKHENWPDLLLQSMFYDKSHDSITQLITILGEYNKKIKKAFASIKDKYTFDNVLEILINNGANANLTLSGSKQTLLVDALHDDNIKNSTVQLLLAGGANIEYFYGNIYLYRYGILTTLLSNPKIILLINTGLDLNFKYIETFSINGKLFGGKKTILMDAILIYKQYGRFLMSQEKSTRIIRDIVSKNNNDAYFLDCCPIF